MPPKPHPTLIIGLGGTGQWVACHVLKELMELYGVRDSNQLDPRVRILAVDTDFANEASVGVGQRSEMGGVSVGQIELPGTMRVPIGANVSDYAKQISNGEHPETAAWFDAGWFLAQPNHATLLNLSHGAGQFRPLGRIAVPYNLRLGGGALRHRLQAAIQGIKNHMVEQGTERESLIVCIAGSLCGGTGAGMFVDVAHLVHTLAAPTNVLARGYLVLPNAFEGTVPPAPDGGTEFRRRAFAAMRELRRFAREIDYEIGYPMYYAGDEILADGVLRGRLNGTLFDLLHYFDASLMRVEKQALPGLPATQVTKQATVEEGIVPLIAEAILLLIDGQTSAQLLTHTTNLTVAKTAMVTGGKLNPQAAVAGGMGLFSLHLPLYHIIDEWAHDMSRDVLRRFLGVPAEGGEDETTKTVITLRDDWAGGKAGPSGTLAAQREWRKGQVGGIGLSSLVADLLETDVAVTEGVATRDRRVTDLRTRSLDDWHSVLRPAGGIDDDDQALVDQFLHPQQVVIERGGILNRPQKVRRSQVPTSAALPGQARKDEKRNPGIAAQRICGDVESYLDQHLGSVDVVGQTRSRGGRDDEPEGEYPLMLRLWAVGHVAQWQAILRAWVAEALNGTESPDRTAGETADTAAKNRVGKLGYTLALLAELTRLASTAEDTLAVLKDDALGVAISSREATEIDDLSEKMDKDTGAQGQYLKAQQDVLDAERAYAAIRAIHYAAGKMHAFTKDALDALDAWKDVLASELYHAVWQGQEQIATNLADMSRLNAVRQIVDLPAIKSDRYRFYAETQKNAMGEILNDLRWQVGVGEVYDPEQASYSTRLEIGLELGDGNPLHVDGGEGTSREFLNRCREVFADAWQSETILGWLTEHYDNSTTDRQISRLAQELADKAHLTLSLQPGANPYRFAYLRAQPTNALQTTWLNALLTNITQAAGADAVHSTTVASTDSRRVVFILFNELVDVEYLQVYVEGRDGISGTGGYVQLPAKSDTTGLSRQVLHVFAAERNAAPYEERLGYLLPDKVVALLEDPARFRQFAYAWAYGQMADAQEILLHEYRLPDDHAKAGWWVWRLTTGPFEGEIDPHTCLPKPAQIRWLSLPEPSRPALITAAETFLLRGVDKWQSHHRPLDIDYETVGREIARRRAALVEKATLCGCGSELRDLVERLPDARDRQECRVLLADIEHLRALQARLSREVIPAMEEAAGRSTEVADSEPSSTGVGVFESDATELDLMLFKVLNEFLFDEVEVIEKDIRFRCTHDAAPE